MGIGPVLGGGSQPVNNQVLPFSPPSGVKESLVTLQQEIQKFEGDISANQQIDPADLDTFGTDLISFNQQLQEQFQTAYEPVAEGLGQPGKSMVDFLTDFAGILSNANSLGSSVMEAAMGLGQTGMATQMPILLKQLDDFLAKYYLV